MDMTNLHFHGLTVSPDAPQDDVLDMIAAPGRSLSYTVEIPKDHPPGLYWYHTHPHGESHRQVLDGMSGALVIEGIESYLPSLVGLPERVLIVRGRAIKNDPHSGDLKQRVDLSSDVCGGEQEPPEEVFTVNGFVRPQIEIAPDERQFWRLVNASADRYLDLQLEGQSFEIIAMDGMPIARHDPDHRTRVADHVLLPPAGRIEAIVTGPIPAAPRRLISRCVDTGPQGDPHGNAQNMSIIMGKMLRIDVNVSNATGYVVPSTNPFVSGGPTGVLKEIWSFGLRNPWRYSFDMPSRGGTGALIIADVGQGAWEEIDYEPAGRSGRNYGWRVREGAHDNVTSPAPVYKPTDLTNPIWEYSHSVGQSITGGFVYRGSALPAFLGRYFFADYVQGRVWSMALTINPSTGEATASAPIDHTADLGGSVVIGNISSFGLDAAGELYVVNHTGGSIVQIVGGVPPTPPTNLRIIR